MKTTKISLAVVFMMTAISVSQLSSQVVISIVLHKDGSGTSGGTLKKYASQTFSFHAEKGQRLTMMTVQNHGSNASQKCVALAAPIIETGKPFPQTGAYFIRVQNSCGAPANYSLQIQLK